jgi:hypothetical protein
MFLSVQENVKCKSNNKSASYSQSNSIVSCTGHRVIGYGFILLTGPYRTFKSKRVNETT